MKNASLYSIFVEKSPYLGEIMKRSLKTSIYLCLFTGIFSLVSCSSGSGDSLDEPKYVYEIPTFNAGDIYRLSLDDYNDIYCFTGSGAGKIISNAYTDTRSEVASYDFTYNSGDTVVEGTSWISFMVQNDYIKAFNKANAFKSEDPEDGLYSTYLLGNVELELSSSGKATMQRGDDSPATGKFRNEDGLVTVWDSSASLQFYYIEGGYLVPVEAISTLEKCEEAEIHLNMTSYADTGKINSFLSGLPNDFIYKLIGLKKADPTYPATVRTILDNNTNKKFAIYAGDMSFSENIQAYYFEGRQNLYEIDFGHPSLRAYYLSSNGSKYLSLGNSAFKDCINLKKVDTDMIYKIGENCFDGCTALKEITIEKGRRNNSSSDAYFYIEKNAFNNSGLRNITFDNSFYSWKYKDTSGDDFTSATSIAVTSGNAATLLTGTYVDKYWECRAH